MAPLVHQRDYESYDQLKQRMFEGQTWTAEPSARARPQPQRQRQPQARVPESYDALKARVDARELSKQQQQARTNREDVGISSNAAHPRTAPAKGVSPQSKGGEPFAAVKARVDARKIAKANPQPNGLAVPARPVNGKTVLPHSQRPPPSRPVHAPLGMSTRKPKAGILTSLTSTIGSWRLGRQSNTEPTRPPLRIPPTPVVDPNRQTARNLQYNRENGLL